jgi:hypothetical protein
MSKVEELKLKYNTLTSQTFNKFLDADKTPTKKYLEFLLKSWVGRGINNCPKTTDSLISFVKKFDELLPYIQNKDIYHKEYNDFSLLKVVVARAEEVKEEKTFIKEENVVVLIENDDYILLEPITHRGSLKYGANTRWCTASKRDETTFKRYIKNGLLVYLIDKRVGKVENYKKVALYCEYNKSSFTSYVVLYNSNDAVCDDDALISANWTQEEIFNILTTYRVYFAQSKKTKKAKDNVQNVTSTLSKINFEELLLNVQLLEQSKNVDYISNLRSTINTLINELNKPNYARFTETKS